MNVFIIGAGFTKSVFPDAPLNRELFGALSNKRQESVAQALRTRYGTEDIEIALTRLDLDDDQKKHSLRRKAEAELARLFAGYVASFEIFSRNPWLKHFADKIVSPGDVAISLNYDCLFEGILDCLEKWSPVDGYGKVFGINPLISKDEYAESPVRVLKIHGSVSFRITSYADKPSAKAVDFDFNDWFFPRSAANTDFRFGGADARPYLIAPSYVKIPAVEIVYLMLESLNAVAEAKNLVAIGCSLRPEDAFLSVIATHFLRQDGWQNRKFFIVDPCAGDICSRFKNYWGVNVDAQIIPIERTLENSLELLTSSLSVK